MEYQAIVLAAGNSSRSGLNYNKVLFELNGTPIITLSTRNFLTDTNCSKVVIVCKPIEQSLFKTIFKDNEKIVYANGGETRQDSVSNALAYIDAPYVLIHDGARPYFTQILLNRLLEKLKEVDAVIPTWSVTDTIKQVKNGVVVKTLKRDELKAVQTPQAFKTSLIKQAHILAKHKNYTDDSSMVEDLLDVTVYAIDGEYTNTKFTYKEDF